MYARKGFLWLTVRELNPDGQGTWWQEGDEAGPFAFIRKPRIALVLKLASLLFLFCLGPQPVG